MQFIHRQAIGNFLTALLAVLTGCTTSRPGLVLDTIGPISGGRANFAGISKGFLEVHSATRIVDSGGIIFQPNTSYSVYSLEGKRLWGVLNHVGDEDSRPMTIEIPPGVYVIYAESDRFGQVKVPVLVVGSKTTVVYLEGKGMAKPANLPDSDFVFLPDGRIAGRRAEDAAPPAKTP